MSANALTMRSARMSVLRERVIPVLLSLAASAGLGFACVSLFPGLSTDIMRPVVMIAFSVTLPAFVATILLARSRPLWVLGIVMLAIFMRLTAVALVAIWLQAKQPESLRPGLLVLLVYVGGFLLFEIVALPASGLHRFVSGIARGRTIGRNGQEPT